MRPTPPKVPRPTPVPLAASPAVERLRRDRERAGADAGAAERVVERFWSKTAARTPLIESYVSADDGADECVVTFLWRSDTAEEVLLFANRMTDERRLADSLMRRVAATDVWHLSYRMRADWRASYSFLVREAGERAPWRRADDQIALRAALDRGLPDPRAREEGPNREGIVQSVASLPAAPAANWTHPRHDTPRGVTTRLDGPDGRPVWVHEPPHPPSTSPLPILVVLDGEIWAGSQDLPTTVDNLVADGLMRPSLVVMPDSGGIEQRWHEMGAGGDAAGWVADLLLPWVRERRAVTEDPDEVVIAGQSLGGLAALRLVLTRPDAARRAISQSASLWQDDLAAELAGAGDVSSLRLRVAVGMQEWVLRQPNADIAARLTHAGATVEHVEYNGGHDYACWRVDLAEGLRSLLPASPEG